MVEFTQPQNRERDLQAIMEGYEGRIKHKYWLAEAIQKDAIQNSWDARRRKDWSFTLFYLSQSPQILGFIDKGTYGLTGIVPNNRKEAVDALCRKTEEEKKEERLAYFLSSDWSNKPKTAIGSRGRGKMIFIGASRDKAIYFDSFRYDDKRYVFGRTFLDGDKAIKVEVYQGETAQRRRTKIFKDRISPLSHPGTRVLLFNPKEELVEAIISGEMERLIQYIWWEILHKHKAKIEIKIDGKSKLVALSPFLPVENLGVKEFENSGLIKLKKDPSLRIKNIALCYLGDKDIPEHYKGLAIQEGGMVVERLKIEELIDNPVGSKIYGTVTFDERLEEKMSECEGPEHYNFLWTRDPARLVRGVLRSEARNFAIKYKLLEESKKHISKEQRETEIAVQNELNKLAKILNLTGIASSRRRRGGGTRSPTEKIRLSIADFKTPYESGRVDKGQVVEGIYVIPINEYSTSLEIWVKAYIFYQKNGSEICYVEKKLTIPEEKARVGWPLGIKIDDSFKKGGYTFRAEMRSLEDKKINKNLSYEKGELVYHPVSRAFYVEEDPSEKGFFRVENRVSPDERKFIWVEEIDEENILCYNLSHPTIKRLKDDKTALRDLLFQEGVYFAYGIRLSEDKALIDQGEKPLIFKEGELKNNDFQTLLQRVAFQRSGCLWERDK